MAPRVVIVGAGFGGLHAAKALAGQPVDVLLIDRNNYHTFVPLLYQVATAGLEPEEIAAPVRGIARRARNINFALGEVSHIDLEQRCVMVKTDDQERMERFDYLILSPGTVTSYFGLKDVQARAFGLKSLSEAVNLRNHVLTMFERATSETDPALREALTTFVVVGGGPTGLELSGSLCELFRQVLRKDYPSLDFSHAHVILVEATDKLLAAFPEALQKSALRQVQSLGADVQLNKVVERATEDAVFFKDGSHIQTHTLIWAAGVQAAEMAGIDLKRERAGRLRTEPTLQLAAYPNVYVIGDANFLEDEHGQAYPQLAPVAMQMGKVAAQNIVAALAGQPLKPFRYNDRGIMATIGKSKAVAYVFNKVQMSGYLAWVAWLVLHLIYLIGFRNRANVLVNWAWNWWTWERGVRIILKL